MLKLLYTSPVPVANLLSTSIMYWHTASDSLFVAGVTGAANGSQRVYRDGTVQHVSRITLNGDVVRFDHLPGTADVHVRSTSWDGAYQLHPLLWTTDLQRPFTTTLPVADMGGGVILRNRGGVLKYHRPFGRGYRTFDYATGTLEDTVEIYPSGGSIHPRMHWAQDQTILTLRGSNIRLWDLTEKRTVLDSFVETPRMIAFDYRHQNIVTIRQSDNRIQVWATEIQPFKFGNLQSSPGEHLRFQKEDLSIQVLGEQDEPVPGVHVYWEIDATPVKGHIIPSVSTTDENGFAHATYCPPGINWDPGDQEDIISRFYVGHMPLSPT